MPAITVIRGPLGDVIARVGGVDAFAELLNVWPHTVWRWGTKRTRPALEMQKRINGIARRYKLRVPFHVKRVNRNGKRGHVSKAR